LAFEGRRQSVENEKRRYPILGGLDRVSFQHLPPLIPCPPFGGIEESSADTPVAILLVDEEADHRPDRRVVDWPEYARALETRELPSRGHGAPGYRSRIVIRE